MNNIVKKDVDRFIENFNFFDELRNCRVVVTGATGLIGSTIIRCLSGINMYYCAKIDIVGLVRNVEKAKGLFEDDSITWKCYDLVHPFELDVDSVDYIFHCACPTSSKFYVENPVELIKTSVQGSMSILDYARNHPVKGVVYLSSCEVYGSVYDDRPFDETYSGYVNPTDVRSGYPMSKRLVECLCHSYAKEYGVPVTIARLTQTFGAGVSLEDNRVFAQFAKSAIKNENIVMHTKGDSSKPYCYTIDAVNALIYLLLKGEAGEAYNIANYASYISIKDLALFVANNFSKGARVVIEENDGMGYAPVTKLHMKTAKLEALGWKPLYSLTEMFSNLIEYYKTL